MAAGTRCPPPTCLAHCGRMKCRPAPEGRGLHTQRSETCGGGHVLQEQANPPVASYVPTPRKRVAAVSLHMAEAVLTRAVLHLIFSSHRQCGTHCLLRLANLHRLNPPTQGMLQQNMTYTSGLELTSTSCCRHRQPLCLAARLCAMLHQRNKRNHPALLSRYGC